MLKGGAKYRQVQWAQPTPLLVADRITMGGKFWSHILGPCQSVLELSKEVSMSKMGIVKVIKMDKVHHDSSWSDQVHTETF